MVWCMCHFELVECANVVVKEVKCLECIGGDLAHLVLDNQENIFGTTKIVCEEDAEFVEHPDSQLDERLVWAVIILKVQLHES